MIIAFPHKASPIGGPGSFQTLLEKKILFEKHTIIYAGENEKIVPDVVLVVGGTRKLFWLIKLKIKGTKIVHRLDGKNWQQTILSDGFFVTCKSRIVNWLIAGIKFFLADAVIYQSRFVASIWNEKKKLKKNHFIVYNSVNLKEFKPVNKKFNCNSSFSIVCVEGSVNGSPALNILRSIKSYPIEIYGNISKPIRKSFKKYPQDNICFKGPVSRNIIKEKLAGLKVFLNLETNPPCPNSVIEALSCGVPVVGFDSGSLKELVGQAGIVLPYGNTNPWKLESPCLEKIELAINEIIKNYAFYSKQARKRGVKLFSHQKMYLKYKEILFE